MEACMPTYACHKSESCHVSPEAKLRMLYLVDLTRYRKGMKEWFTAAQRRRGKGEGGNVNIFRKTV